MPAVKRGPLGRTRPLIVNGLAVAVFILVAWSIISAWRQELAPPEPLGHETDSASLRGASGHADATELAARVREDPVASAPFVDAALLVDRLGQGGRAAEIMNHAVRLNPRDTSAHAWLFVHNLQGGHFASAIEDAYVLYQLEPALEPTLSRTLGILVQLNDLRAMIRHQFYASPYLGSIIAAAPKGSLSEVAIVELIAALPRSARAEVQAQHLTKLLREGDYVAVSRALRNFGVIDRPRDNLIADGSFEQRGLRPFNWTLTSDADIHAAPVRTDVGAIWTALHIERFGSASATGAQQSILIHPGRYHLSHLLKAADVPPDLSAPAPFLWIVTCPGLPHPELARFPVGADAEKRWVLHYWTFEVPISCGLIDLALTASFSDTVVHADLLLTRVRLARVREPSR